VPRTADMPRRGNRHVAPGFSPGGGNFPKAPSPAGGDGDLSWLRQQGSPITVSNAIILPFGDFREGIG
jgi:hypothetical protein